jgi:Cof subfamily protein (haloacid dehalogenase superfamily)
VISLVISDVDGTLVTPDKRLTDASVRAVRSLHDRGIGFTIVSSRPPCGMRMLVEPLALTLPLGAFSGGTIVGPDLAPIEQHLVPEPAAGKSLDLLKALRIDAWVFTADQWLVRDPGGDYVGRERRTIAAEPRVVTEFAPWLAQVCKIVGSSSDFARLAECEVAMRAALGGQASIARSQSYYLDITPPGRDKGTFVEAMSARLAIPAGSIAVLGDGENDVAMFRKAGLAIAMGNASPKVRQQAAEVTASNAEDGFAAAIERYVLNPPSRSQQTARP